MSDDLPGSVIEENRNPVDETGARSVVVYLLAALWVILPALQYIGSYQRTLAVTDRNATVGAVGTADFSVWYICLCAVTAGFIVWRAYSARNMETNRNGIAE